MEDAEGLEPSVDSRQRSKNPRPSPLGSRIQKIDGGLEGAAGFEPARLSRLIKSQVDQPIVQRALKPVIGRER